MEKSKEGKMGMIFPNVEEQIAERTERTSAKGLTAMGSSPEEYRQQVERAKRIEGLRQIVDFLDEHKEIPVNGIAGNSFHVYLEYAKPEITLDGLVKVWEAMGQVEFEANDYTDNLRLVREFEGDTELVVLISKRKAGQHKPEKFELDERLRTRVSYPAED